MSVLKDKERKSAWIKNGRMVSLNKNTNLETDTM